MSAPVFANSGSIQPVQGGEVACCSIAGGPFAVVDAYVAGGGGAGLQMRLYATVGALRTLIAVAPYSGPPVGAPAGQGQVLEWIVVGQAKSSSPVIAGGTQYDLVVFGVDGGGAPIKATLAGTNAYDAAVNQSGTAALPSNYGSSTIATNVGCANTADVGVALAGLPSTIAFDVLVSCGAGSVEAVAGTAPIGGTDGNADPIRELPLPVGTQYRLAVRDTSGGPQSGNVTASLATYVSSVGSGGGAIGALNGDVHGPPGANLIHNFGELDVTTPEFFGAVGDGITNDYAAVQAAIASGHDVFFGKKYLCDGAGPICNVTTPGQRLFGAGDQSQILTTSNATIIKITAEDCSVTDMRVTGNGLGAAQIGIASTDLAGGIGARNLRIVNVTVENVALAGIMLFNAPGGQVIGPQIIGCRIKADVGGAGITTTYGIWCLTEYTIIDGCEIGVGAGVCEGVRIQAGNVILSNSVITDCTQGAALGVHITAAGNDGHGCVIGCEINHNTTNVLVDDAIVNGMPFIGCNFYGVGTAITIGSAKNIRFQSCAIDCNLAVGGTGVATFDGCLWPQQAVVNPTFTIAATALVTFQPNNIDLDGQFPTCIATQAPKGTSWPRLFTGAAASGGGTFVAALNSQAPAPLSLPPNGTAHVHASVKMVGGSPVTDSAAFDTECEIMIVAGVASLPAAIAPSANPSTTLAASTAGFIGVGPTPPSAVFSIVGGNLVMTVTNPGAVNATVTINFDIKVAS